MTAARPVCRLGGTCDLVSRDYPHSRESKIVGVAQCIKCSIVYEATAWRRRQCDHCGKEWGESLHDPCIGTIDGAVEACCGHGRADIAYVSYTDGRRLTGDGVPWR